MTSPSCRVPKLFGIALATQAFVDTATPSHQDLFERCAEVAVEPGVDNRVEEAVGVAEPQQKAIETVRDARRRIFAPRLDEGQQEERKPAGRECSHYDAKRLGCFAINVNQFKIFISSADLFLAFSK